jgi:hypothetical protein
MPQSSRLIATLGLLVSLSACVPPEDTPPPRFRPQPPYAPEPVEPQENRPYQETPPPAPQPSPAPPAAPDRFPTATRTDNPNEVLSPFEPYNVIDIAGFKTGQLARDPSNKKIFRVP